MEAQYKDRINFISIDGSNSKNGEAQGNNIVNIYIADKIIKVTKLTMQFFLWILPVLHWIAISYQ